MIKFLDIKYRHRLQIINVLNNMYVLRIAYAYWWFFKSDISILVLVLVLVLALVLGVSVRTVIHPLLMWI